MGAAMLCSDAGAAAGAAPRLGMCGRFTLTTADYEHVAQALDADFDPEAAAAWRPRFNVAPTDRHPVLVRDDGRRRLALATWGLVAPRDEGLPRPPIHINARAETLAGRGLFRGPLQRLRLGVVADGFYEWTGPRQARQPIRFHRGDGRPFVFAAVATRPRTAQGTVALPRFAIVTTAPNARVAAVHDRMPVILDDDDIDAWLSPPPDDAEPDAWLAGLTALLHTAPDDALVATPASPRVNDVRNDDPACLEPPLTLF